MTDWTIEAAAIAAEFEDDRGAWQWLYDTGHVYRLNDWFRRMVYAMLSAGEIER